MVSPASNRRDRVAARVWCVPTPKAPANAFPPPAQLPCSRLRGFANVQLLGRENSKSNVGALVTSVSEMWESLFHHCGAVLHGPGQLCIHGNPLKTNVWKEFSDWASVMVQLFLGFQLVPWPAPYDLEGASLPSVDIIWEISVGWNFSLCAYH